MEARALFITATPHPLKQQPPPTATARIPCRLSIHRLTRRVRCIRALHPDLRHRHITVLQEARHPGHPQATTARDSTTRVVVVLAFIQHM